MASDPAIPGDPELQGLFEKLDACISNYQYKKALKFCTDSTCFDLDNSAAGQSAVDHAPHAMPPHPTQS